MECVCLIPEVIFVVATQNDELNSNPKKGCAWAFNNSKPPRFHNPFA